MKRTLYRRLKSLDSPGIMPVSNNRPMKPRCSVSFETFSIFESDQSLTYDSNILNSSVSSHKSLKISKKKSSKTVILGLFYALLSGLFFSACAASVKDLTALDPAQVALYQYISTVVFSLPMVIRKNTSIFGPERVTKYWCLLCGVFDAITIYLSFVSFRNLPLSDATALTSSVPVFVTIAARIFLKEKCGTFQIFAILISVLGVALVSKVPLLMANRTDVYTRKNIIGLLACFGSITTESGVYIILRKLHNVNVYIILFNFGIVATIINALFIIGFGEFSWTVCGKQQWLVIAMSSFSFLSQLTLTKALELEDAGPVAVLMSAGDIVLAFILDMSLFLNTPDMYTIGGTVLVILSVTLIGFKKWISNNENSKRSSLKVKFMKVTPLTFK